MGGQTHEHTGVGVSQSRWRGARMLHRAPRRLQQEPMLRVHQPDLARRHTEERRVEPRHVIDETRTTGHDLAGRTGFRVEEFVDIPAVLGHLRYRVATLAQHVPKPIGIRCTRETRCIADDCKPGGRLRSDVRRIPCRCPPCIGGQNVTLRDTCRAARSDFPPTDTIARAPVACAASLSGVRPAPGDCGRTLGMLIPRGVVLPDSEPAKPGGRRFAHREDNCWRT